jgi:hypothetical protein
VSLNLPYDPKGWPDDDEELRILQAACLDAFGPCGDEVPVELQRALGYHRACVVGRHRATVIASQAARARDAERRLTNVGDRISELERKRVASGKHIADLHRKLHKLKVMRAGERDQPCV